jgi:thiol-disulfide isomerase/thioredoxin
MNTSGPLKTRLTLVMAGLAAVAGAAALILADRGGGSGYTASAANPSLRGPVAAAPAAQRPPATPMAFADGDGKALSLDDFHGRTILLNLWATWCAPCLAEMPALDALQAKLGGPGFQVVAVSLDRGGAPVARAWMTRNNVRNLGLYSADAANHAEASLPTSLLIDAQGRVAWRGLGARAWDSAEVEAVIKALMEER